MNKYEIPLNYFDGRHHETIVGLLTGLTLEEIEAVTTRKRIWFTRDYKNAFLKLGFNTNVRFIPFDPHTEYPCIMRCRLKKDNGYWYGFVYYDNWVYCSSGQLWPFARFFEIQTQYRATSMLQVWI